MRAKAYYNEFEPYAAEWLRNLISAGHIAPGDVDERSIEDVTPDDLRGYTQCHFFAGIGVWSYALRNAGWPDDRPVWTGSCPCQPFSAAGKGGGFADERHLWPAFHHLIGERRPPVVLGEQVASKDGLGWLDLVQADLEGTDYASGAVDLCAAGVGVAWEESLANEWLQRAIRDCPDPWIADQLRDFADWASGNISEGGGHIRQRLFWVGERLDHSAGARHVRPVEGSEGNSRHETRLCVSGAGCSDERLAHHHHQPGLAIRSGQAIGRGTVRDEGQAVAAGLVPGRLADADGGNAGSERQQRGGEQRQQQENGGVIGLANAGSESRQLERQKQRSDTTQPGQQTPRRDDIGGRSGPDGARRPGPVNGIWRDADWLFCRDGKWRPVEPGTFPLAHGAPARVGRLRAYGNAIVAQAAQAFIEAYLESRNA